MFFFYELIQPSGNQQVIVEITASSYTRGGGGAFSALYNIHLTSTIMGIYQSSITGIPNAFYKIFSDPTLIFLHSVNANVFTPRPSTTYNTGYLMKDHIASQGSTPMITIPVCSIPIDNNMWGTLTASGIVTWVGSVISPPYASFYGLLISDDGVGGMAVGLQIQDLPQI